MESLRSLMVLVVAVIIGAGCMHVPDKELYEGISSEYEYPALPVKGKTLVYFVVVGPVMPTPGSYYKISDLSNGERIIDFVHAGTYSYYYLEPGGYMFSAKARLYTCKYNKKFKYMDAINMDLKSGEMYFILLYGSVFKQIDKDLAAYWMSVLSFDKSDYFPCEAN